MKHGFYSIKVEYNLNKLIRLVAEFAQRVLRDGPRPSQGNKSDQAHPPIHPIKYTNSLTGNEKRIYEFVVRHFLACLSKNAEGLETVVDISIAEEMVSKFTGLRIFVRRAGV